MKFAGDGDREETGRKFSVVAANYHTAMSAMTCDISAPWDGNIN